MFKDKSSWAASAVSPPTPPKPDVKPSPSNPFSKKLRSASPDSEIRRMKTRLRKSETENMSMKEHMGQLEKELRSARDALQRGAMEGEFSRVLNLDDPKERRLFESEEKLKKQHAKEVFQLREEIDRLASELTQAKNMSNRDTRQTLDKLEDSLMLERRKFMQETELLRQKHEDEKAMLRAKIAQQYHDEVRSQEDKLQHLQAEHLAKIETITAKYETQARALRNQIKDLQDRAKTSQRDQNILKEAQTEWSEKMDSMNQKLHLTQQEYNFRLEEMGEMHAETIEKMTKEFDNEHALFKEQLATLKEQHDNDLKNVQVEYEEKSANLKEQNAALKSKLDDTLNELAAKDAQSGEEIAVLTTNYDKKIEAILADHDEKIETFRKQQETDHAVRVAGWEAKLRKADEMYYRKMERLEQKHLEDLANSAANMEDLKKKLADYEGTEGHYKMRLADEKEKRQNAVRKFQIEREKRLLLEQQYSMIEETQE